MQIRSIAILLIIQCCLAGTLPTQITQVPERTEDDGPFNHLINREVTLVDVEVPSKRTG